MSGDASLADAMTVVLLLRSVNVGGNRMRMAWLRDLATSVGCVDVRSVLATGNLVVTVGGDGERERRDLERALAQQYGGVDVVLRTAGRLADAVGRNPWTNDVVDGRREGRFVHTMFLATVPDPAAAIDLPAEHDGDVWTLDGREVFVAYDGSSNDSRFSSAWFERNLGVVGTARNHNTVTKVLAAATTEA